MNGKDAGRSLAGSHGGGSLVRIGAIWTWRRVSATVDAAINVIEEDSIPLSSLPEEAADSVAKRLIPDRFPYDIVVIELPEEAVVIAVAHHSRKPGYWRERSKP